MSGGEQTRRMSKPAGRTQAHPDQRTLRTEARCEPRLVPQSTFAPRKNGVADGA
ncbi:hypothetical protein CZ774_11320 [Frigoribacterium sp. JB110]|nr:hypothetical protein CZ774_11320 [Frigoribacterium sp. JB110]